MTKSILEINKLILPILIGVDKLERLKPQAIEFNISLEFHQTPKACESDNINDAVCYDKLVTLIEGFCSKKEFHLIEHLGYLLHQYLQTNLPSAKLKLQVCKTPPIKAIKGNCCFTIY